MTKKVINESTEEVAAVVPSVFQYGGIDLEILDQQDQKVPTFADVISLPSEDERALALAVKENLATLLIGETGTGKTSAIRYLALLRKQGYTRINMHGYNTPDELIGSTKVKDGSTYHEDGILVDAMRKGHMVVLDEINATPPDCMFILHGLLDDDHMISLPNGEVVKPHKDFRFFATMNPDYEGTRSLNRAFLDRFNVILFVDILAPDKESKLLQDRCGVDAGMSLNMVTLAHMARKSYKESKTSTLVSTRSLLQWARLIKLGLDPLSAYQKSIIHKTRQDEHAAFEDFYHVQFGTNPNKAKDTHILIPKSNLDDLSKKVEKAETEKKKLENKVKTMEQEIKDFDQAKTKLDAIEKEIEGFEKLQHELDLEKRHRLEAEDKLGKIRQSISISVDNLVTS